IVGERFAPIETIGINAPRPNFPCGKIFILSEVDDPSVRTRIPQTHEILAASMGEHGDWALFVIAVDAVINTVHINGPRMNLGESMSRDKAHRILNPRIVPDFNARVIPPVKAMSHIAAIA